MNEFPQIFTFYSFKGGVGRSMAVLNLAYALSAKGRHVLVLDMDLEAPGLSGFLRRHGEIPKCAPKDMIDLLQWARDCSQVSRQKSEPPTPESFPPLTDYIARGSSEKLRQLAGPYAELGRIDVIPVDEDRKFYKRLTSLAISGFDRETLISVGNLLRAWLKSRVFTLDLPEYYGPNADRAGKYDYVLVDSRTGVTEVGGLCIGPLSDQLVILTALNDQNVVGTRRFLAEVGILAVPAKSSSVDDGPSAAGRRLDPKPTLIVASPVPVGELESKGERLRELEKEVGQVAVKLSYHPQMALLESIFTRDFPEEHLAREYATLLSRLMEAAHDRARLDPADGFIGLHRAPSEERHSRLRTLLRSASAVGPEMARVFVTLIGTKVASDDEDFVLMDRIFRVACSTAGRQEADALTGWADLLSDWSSRSPNGEIANLRRTEALHRYTETLQYDHLSARQKATALFNRGVTYGRQGDWEKAIADYTAVLEMPDAPAEQKAEALVNRGVAHGQQGDSEKEIADCTAVLDMPDAPAEQKARALVYRGVTYRQQGDLEKAIADCTAVLDMPDAPAEQKAQALVNRGVTHGQQSDSEKAIADYTAVLDMPDAPAEQKATALIGRGWRHYVAQRIESAIDDQRRAISLSPDDCRAHGNLAVALLVHGQTDEALGEYDTALKLASAENLADLKADLEAAIEKHGSLPGASDVLARIAARLESLHDAAETEQNSG